MYDSPPLGQHFGGFFSIQSFKMSQNVGNCMVVCHLQNISIISYIVVAMVNLNDY